MNKTEKIGITAALLAVTILSWIPSVALHELTHVWQSSNVKIVEICLFGWNSEFGVAWVLGRNLLHSEILPIIAFYGLWFLLLIMGFWVVLGKYEDIISN